MEQNQSTYDEGISLSELFSYIWKRKIMIAIATLATAVLVLLIVFLINPILEKTNFDLQYSFLSDSETTLPDKSYFNYNDIVGREQLETVKASDAAYKDIDIDEILLEEYIQITQLEQSNGTQYYTITAKSSAFINTKTAKKFIKDLIDLFEARVLLAVDYPALESFVLTNAAITGFDYEDIINLAQSTYNTLTSSYERLISLNPQLSIQSTHNTVTIQNVLNNLKTHFSVYKLDSLKLQVIENNYIKDDQAKESIALEITQLQKELTLQESIRDAYISTIQSLTETSSATTVSLDAFLANTIARIENLKDSIRVLEDRLNYGVKPADSSAFVLELNASLELIDEATHQYNEFNSIYTNSRADIRVIGNNDGKTTGSISLVLAAVAGIILGAGASSVAAIILETNKKKNPVSN